MYPRENPAENQVPKPFKKFVNQRFTSAKTNGNGACSIHALLGRAHHGELYCQNDREVIKTSFERGLREHSARAEIYTLLAAWWGELGASIADKRHERDEVGMLWRALPASMKQKCLETAQEDQRRKRMAEPQRRQALAHSCRMFFPERV